LLTYNLSHRLLAPPSFTTSSLQFSFFDFFFHSFYDRQATMPVERSPPHTRTQSLIELTEHQEFLDTEIDKINFNVTALSEKVHSLESQTAGIAADASRVNATVDQLRIDLRTNFHDLVARLDSLVGRLASPDSAVNQEIKPATDIKRETNTDKPAPSLTTPFPAPVHSVQSQSIRPLQPPTFSGSERPRIDPKDHIFTLDLWLRDQPESHKLDYAAGTLSGTARKEWRLCSAGKRHSYSSFCEWFLNRFKINDPAEQARARIRNAIQSGRSGSLDAYCDMFLNAQSDMGQGHDAELISAFIAGLKMPAAAIELRIRRPTTISEAITIAQNLKPLVIHDSMRHIKYRDQNSKPQEHRSPPPPRINLASVKTKLTPKERQQLIEMGGCVYCRDLKHTIEACPIRPQRPARLSVLRLSTIQSSSTRHLPQNRHIATVVSRSGSSLPASILIDTGAETDFVSTDFCRRADILTYPLLTAQIVESAMNQMSTLSSEATLTFTIPSAPPAQFTRSMLVADINADIILGTAFLHEFNPGIDFRTGNITFNHLSPTHAVSAESGTIPATAVVAADVAFPAVPTISGSQEPIAIATVRSTTDPAADETPPVLPTLSSTITSNTIFHDEKSDPDRFHHDDPAVVKLVLAFRHTVFRDSLPHRLPPVRNIYHEINLMPGSKPPYRQPYRMSPAEQDELSRQLQDYFNAGYIRPSNSPFGAPALFAKKPDGSLRLCLDYRALNAITVKDKTPVPHADDLINHTAKAKIFSKLDLRSAFHQLLIRPQDIPKSAITTKFGNFEWLVMPFGMANAPSSWQAVVNHIFRDILGRYVVVYLDDILIFSTSRQSHLAHVTEVLERLQRNELYAKLSKSHLFTNTVEFLGHILTPDGISPSSSKCDSIQDWPRPTSRKNIRQFLGITGFYRRYIPQYSEIACPLTELLTNGAQFQWSQAAELAFTTLKTKLLSPPILRVAQPDRAFRIEADTSGQATGAVLLQQYEDRWLPVAYSSRKLTPPETRYPVHEQELLGLITAFKTWRHLLYGNSFTAYTDHNSLVHFMKQKTLSGRQARWLESLADFDVTIVYKPGTKMIVADTLSRRPDLATIALNYVVTAKLPLFDKIRAAYSNDPDFGEMYALAQKDPLSLPSPYSLHSHLLFFENRICVPKNVDMRHVILSEYHDPPHQGHLGFASTYLRVSEALYWPNLHSDCRQFCLTCDTCQRNKTSTQKPAGLLQPLSIPIARWSSISMDFMVALPRTPSGFDSIFVVVDRLSKLAHFIPTRSTATAADTASLFFTHIFRHHGLPEEIVSDRDPKFTSSMWTELFKILGTSLRLSTSHHQQTDGQTERIIRIINQLLRCCATRHQNAWYEQLPAIEFAYNSSVSSSSKYSPFFLCNGYVPRTPVALLHRQPAVPTTVESFIEQTRVTLQHARDSLHQAQDRQRLYADRRRRDVQFAVGDQVLLSTDHILPTYLPPTKRKLQPTFIGPFTIVEKFGTLTYRLKLPANIRVHPIFHISQLKQFRNPASFPGRLPQPPPAPFEIGNDQYYHAERLLAHRRRRGRDEYLVSWLGYSADQNSWEPANNITSDLLNDFTAREDAVRSAMGV
jgi:hypothetical protein